MSKKVYELANELGIASLDLVEKLKTLGLNVRNHMVTLTSEELSKVMTHFEQAQKAVAQPKKVVVKKVVKKAAAPAPVEEPVATPVETETEAIPVEATTTEVVKESQPVKEVTPVDEPKAKASALVKRKTKAQVDEERKEIAEQALHANDPEAAAIAKANKPKKDYYEEKVHTFTPIFVPEEKKKEPKTGEQRFDSKLAPKAVDDGVIDEDDPSHTKKRVGDLAATMTKKVVVAKVKDINMIRADEELKYAAALVGKTIYTPAKKKKSYMGPTKQTVITSMKESKRVIQLHGGTHLDALAEKLGVKFESFANKMLQMNLLVKPTDYIGIKLANDICAIYNYRVEDTTFKEESVLKNKGSDDKSAFPIRNPIVTIMGHVDHGKTSLLDYIRKEKVAAGEAGGITQHIGAYMVPTSKGNLTFLDTPGHAAFASMRQRGANVTDVVVLVVAGDDGVMPQTVESIKFCKNAEVPVIVAVNKMDKPQSNPEKVKQGLMEFGLLPEEWGGETVFVPVSALTGMGVDDLLEAIALQAEMMELREDTKGNAEGVVIESKIELGRGPVSTILVQKGTLNKGDFLVVGETMGRARSLVDFAGKNIQSAGPSTPVQVLGLESVPNPGDIMNVVKNEREATKIVENRISERKGFASAGAETKKISLEDFFATAATTEATEKKILKLIVRSDVQGSYEAIKSAVERIGNNEVAVEVIGGGVGAITDNDVLLASSVNGYIFGFNMRPVTTARKLAEEKGVDVKTYSIIYELINDVTLALEGMLTPERVEKYLGRAQVKETFNIPKIGVIAGTSVVDGKIERGCNIRLLRDGKIIFDGKLSTLKRFKDDVKEVKNGYECGMALENFTDVKVDDVFEAYMMEEKKRTLTQDVTL